jgi:hypothetical protein
MRTYVRRSSETNRRGRAAMSNWYRGEDGAVTAWVEGYRLTVVTLGGMPRFLIHGKVDDARITSPGMLLASGTEETVARAMLAAETYANQRHEYHHTKANPRKGNRYAGARSGGS